MLNILLMALVQSISIRQKLTVNYSPDSVKILWCKLYFT